MASPDVTLCQHVVDAVIYMCVYNLLNFPSGVVPVTRVTDADAATDAATFPTDYIGHQTMKKVKLLSLQG